MKFVHPARPRKGVLMNVKWLIVMFVLALVVSNMYAMTLLAR